jgi:hypothetical protein
MTHGPEEHGEERRGGYPMYQSDTSSIGTAAVNTLSTKLIHGSDPPTCTGSLGCMQPSYCSKQGHCRWNSTTPRKELQ